MDLIDLMETTRFLGEEFLTWIWFRSELQDGHFQLGEDDRLEIFFDDQLTLETYRAEAERHRLSGGAPSFSPEAKQALRQGKRVTKAKLRLGKEGREWVVTVNAQTLGLSGMKIPAVLSKQDDDRFFERMYLIEEAENALRMLYRNFLEIRLDRTQWPAELSRIRQWVGEPAIELPA